MSSFDIRIVKKLRDKLDVALWSGSDEIHFNGPVSARGTRFTP
jgi:hypothetical protein